MRIQWLKLTEATQRGVDVAQVTAARLPDEGG